MDLARQRKIKIDSMEDVTATNMTTVTFSSFSLTHVSRLYVMLVSPSQNTKVFSPSRQLTFGSLDSITISHIAETSYSWGKSACHSLRQKQ